MSIACVIVDIDGTLLDISHREHLLWPHVLPDGSYKPSGPHWDDFHAAAVNDMPYNKIVRLSNALFLGGLSVVLCTGRGEETRVVTQDVLEEHNIYWDYLYMRPVGDPRKDALVKRDMLHTIRAFRDPLFAIEDKKEVIEMYHKEGIRCIQVKHGDLVT